MPSGLLVSGDAPRVRQEGPVGGVGRREVPGEAGFWVFIFGELVMFSAFFVTFMVVRIGQHDEFEAGQAALSRPIGVANTILLLTGSLFVVIGLRAARFGQKGLTTTMLSAALGCGLLFAVNKVIEYTVALQAGHVASANSFFGYYYLFTGYHLLHLIIGMVALGVIWGRLRSRDLGERDHQSLENAGTFWHLIDLVWVVLFTILYLAN